MPALAGHECRGAFRHDGANVALSPGVTSGVTNNFAARLFDPASARLAGARAGGTVSPAARPLAACAARAFADLYYHRVHVSPRRLDLGDVIDPQQRTIEVWNAHFASRALTNITETGTNGASLAGPRAKTFAALESYSYQLAVGQTGPPQFAGSFEWLFGAEAPRLDVTGQRVVAFPFRHNWDAAVEERLSYLTDVQRSRSGSEQRRSLRDHARRTLAYEVLLSDARARRRFEALMFGWQHRVFSVPVETDATWLAADLPAGERTFPLPVKYRDFEPGGMLMFLGSHTAHETAEIESVTDTSVTLKRGTNRPWARGTTVLPCRRAVLPPSVRIDARTATVERVRLEWELQTSERSTKRAVALPRAVYRSADILMRKDNAFEDQTIDVARRFDRLDFETGSFRNVAPEKGTSDTTDWRLLLNGRAEISDFIAWFDARAGRQRGVWVPTWDYDFEIRQAVTETSNVMSVEHMNYARMYTTNGSSPNPARRDIIFVRTDGTAFCRRITGASEAEDGSYETISLDGAFGANFSPSDFDRISFLNYRRLDQDSLTLSWITDECAQVAFRFKDLLDAP